MPKDFFEWTAEQAQRVVAIVRGESVPPSAPLPRQRKPLVEVCVFRYGTCITHGNADSSCASDRD